MDQDNLLFKIKFISVQLFIYISNIHKTTMLSLHIVIFDYEQINSFIMF